MSSIAAERALVLKLQSGQAHDVVVRILVPQPTEQGDWGCQYQILGGPIDRTFRAIGIDSVQALELALRSVQVDLGYIERKHDARFYFLGEPGHEFK